MVRRFLERIAAPVRGLHQAAYLLAALTLASQAIALLRDRLFAHTFGAGHTLDLYYAAFRVPDLVFALVTSLVSAYVLIPRITGADKETTRRILSESATFLVVAGGVVCALIALLMPRFLGLLYPDLVASQSRDAFILLARILLLQPLLLGFTGVIASVTQVHRRFVLFAISPVLYNLGIIGGTVFLYPRYGLLGIGAGVIIGAVFYLLVQVPVVVRSGVFPRLMRPSRETLGIMTDSVPRSLALGMGSITLLALTALASRLGTGAVSVFTFASNLEAVPLALIGSSYAVAAFPALSENATKNPEAFRRILSTSARHIVLWSFVSLGLIVTLRAHIVRVILGSGAFGWGPTRLTAALLAILSVALVAQGLVLLFSRALYAVRQSWRPLAYQVAGGVLSVGLAVLLLTAHASGFAAYFAGLLRVADVPGTDVLLLALGMTLGQLFLALLSILALRSAAPLLARALVRPAFDGLCAALVGGAAAYAVLVALGGIAPLTTLAAVFTQGFFAGIVGVAASLGTLHFLKNPEFRDMAQALLRLVEKRLGPKDVLAPSAEEPAQP
jgi:putative peptidoglycan lipid II flippase